MQHGVVRAGARVCASALRGATAGMTAHRTPRSSWNKAVRAFSSGTDSITDAFLNDIPKTVRAMCRGHVVCLDQHKP